MIRSIVLCISVLLLFPCFVYSQSGEQDDIFANDSTWYINYQNVTGVDSLIVNLKVPDVLPDTMQGVYTKVQIFWGDSTKGKDISVPNQEILIVDFLNGTFSYKYPAGKFTLTLRYLKDSGLSFDVHKIVFNEDLQGEVVIVGQDGCIEHGVDTFLVYLDSSHYQNPPGTDYNLEIKLEDGFEDMWEIMDYKPGVKDTVYAVFNGPTGDEGAALSFKMVYRKDETSIERLMRKTDARMVHVYRTPDLAKIFHYQDSVKVGDEPLEDIQGCTGDESLQGIGWDTTRNEQYKVGNSPSYSARYNFSIDYFRTDSCLEDDCWSGPLRDTSLVDTMKMKFKYPGIYKIHIKASNVCGVDSLWTENIKNQSQKRYIKIHQGGKDKMYCPVDALCLGGEKEIVVISDTAVRMGWDDEISYNLTRIREFNGTTDTIKNYTVDSIRAYKKGKVGTIAEMKGCDSTRIYVHFTEPGLYTLLVNRESFCSPYTYEHRIRIGKKPVLSEQLRQHLVDSLGLTLASGQEINICGAYTYRLPLLSIDTNAMEIDTVRWIYTNRAKRDTLTDGTEIVFDSTGNNLHYVIADVHNYCGWSGTDSVGFYTRTQPDVQLWRDSMAMDDTLCLQRAYPYYLVGDIPENFEYDLELKGSKGKKDGVPFMSGSRYTAEPGRMPLFSMQYEQGGKAYENFVIYNADYDVCKQELKDSVFLVPAPDTVKFDTFFYCASIASINGKILFEQEEPAFDTSEWVLNGSPITPPVRFPDIPLRGDKNDTLLVTTINHQGCFYTKTVIFKPQEAPEFNFTSKYSEICADTLLKASDYTAYPNSNEEVGKGLILTVYRDSVKEEQKIYRTDGTKSDLGLDHESGDTVRLIYHLENESHAAIYEKCFLQDTLILKIHKPVLSVRADTLPEADLTGTIAYSFDRLKTLQKVDTADVSELTWEKVPELGGSLSSFTNLYDGKYDLTEADKDLEYLGFVLSGKNSCGKILRDTLKVYLPKAHIAAHRDTICSNVLNYILWGEGRTEYKFVRDIKWELIEVPAGQDYGKLTAPGQSGVQLTGEKCYYTPGKDAWKADSVKIRVSGCNLFESVCSDEKRIADTISIKVNPAPVSPYDTLLLWVDAPEDRPREKVLYVKDIHAGYGQILHTAGWYWAEVENGGGTLSYENADTLFRLNPPANTEEDYSGRVILYMKGLNRCSDVRDTVTIKGIVKPRVTLGDKEVCAGDAADLGHQVSGDDQYSSREWGKISGNGAFNFDNTQYIPKADADTITDDSIRLTFVKVFPTYREDRHGLIGKKYEVSDTAQVKMYIKPQIELKDEHGLDWESDTICREQTTFSYSRKWVDFNLDTNFLKVRTTYLEGITGNFPMFDLEDGWSSFYFIVYADLGQCNRWQEETQDTIRIVRLSNLSGTYTLDGKPAAASYTVCPGTTSVVLKGYPDAPARDVVWKVEGGTITDKQALETTLVLDENLGWAKFQMGIVSPLASCEDTTWLSAGMVQILMEPEWKLGKDTVLCENVSDFVYEGTLPSNDMGLYTDIDSVVWCKISGGRTERIDSLKVGSDLAISQLFPVTSDDQNAKSFRIYAELKQQFPCKNGVVYSDTLLVSIPGKASIQWEETDLCQGDTLALSREKTITRFGLTNAGTVRWSAFPDTKGSLVGSPDTLYIPSDETAGNDRLLLEIGGLGGCNTIEKTITLNVKSAPAPYFPAPAVKCEGSEVVFQHSEADPAPVTVKWKKNGGEEQTGASAAYVFHDAVKYEVSLEYTYGNGCPSRIYRDSVEIDSLPVPSFVSTPSSPGPVGVGKEMIFTNQTADMEGATVVWKFEDDRTSTRPDTCHYAFAQAYNTFDVKLIVTNAKQCVDSASQPYQVWAKPKAQIDTVGDPNDCAGIIQFDAVNSEGEGLEYTWDFGCEHLSASSVQSPSEQHYPLLYKDSLYRIVLTVENIAGVDRDTAYFRVKSDLKQGFKVLPDKPGCQQVEKVIVDTSWGNGANKHYKIDWGDAGGLEELDFFPIQGKSHHYENDGNDVIEYTIKMQVSDECHTPTDWVENTVSVYPNKIVPDIEITPISPQCFPARITIKNRTPRRTFTSWTIDGLTFENNEDEFEYVLKEPGTHTIRYIVGDGCNDKDGNFNVEVLGSHTLAYNIQPVLCSNQNFEVWVDPGVKDRFTQVKWFFNGVEAGMKDTVSYGRNNQAASVEMMMVANEIASGCPDTVRALLAPIHKTPEVDFGLDTIDHCAPWAGMFTIRTPREQYKTIQWNFDGGDVKVGTLAQDSVEVDFREGHYDVVLRLESFEGCVDSCVRPINVAALPAPQAVAELGQSGTLCYGQPVLFLNKSVNFRKKDRKTYWYFEPGIAPVEDNRDSVYYRFSKPGTYQVWIRVADLCESDSTKLTPLTVEVKGNEHLDFEIDGNYCSRQEMQLKVSDVWKDQFSNYEWDFGDGQTDLTGSAQVTNRYAEGNTYTVKLSARSVGDGCPATKEKPVIIKVSPETNFSITPSEQDSIVGAEMDIVFKNETPGDVQAFGWDFEQGVSVAETEGLHTHRYEIVSGTSFFTRVKLTVTNNAGCTMEKIRDLKVVRKPEPRVSLTVDTCTGQIDFRSLSTGENIAWKWDFGDGTVSSDEQGSHAYTPTYRDSTYRIRFTAKNIAGETTPIDSFITVISALSADFELDPGYDECMKRQEVRKIQNKSRGEAGSYRLDWGDGSPMVTNDFGELSHTYLNTSDTIQRFNVVLTLENGCHSQVRKEDTLTVYPKATPLIGADTLKACYPIDVHFTDRSIGFLPGAKTWWTFEPGLSPVEAKTPTHVFRLPGTYKVLMNVKDACWPDGLSDTLTIRVLGDTLLDFEILDDPLCSRQEVKMRILPHLQGHFGDIQWNFGDQTGPLRGVDSASHVYGMPGNYTVTLSGKSVSEGNCPISQPLPKTITVHKTPISEIQVQPYGGCNPDTLDFLRVFYPGEVPEAGETVYWDFKNGMSVSGKNQVEGVVFNSFGVYDVTLRVTSAAGCWEEDTEPVVIRETPEALFEISDSLFCTQNGVIRIQLTNKTPEPEKSSFEWWYNDQRFSYAPDPSELIPEHGYGKIRIRLRATNNSTLCWDEEIKEVVSSPRVTAWFRKDREAICDETPVVFTDSSLNATRVEWDLGDGNLSDRRSVTHVYEGVGPYVVRLKASNADGCEDVYTDSLVVYPLPQADFNWDFDNSVTGLPDTLVLPEKNNGGVRFENFSTVHPVTWGDSLRYEWDFGDHTGISREKSPLYRYGTNGVYEVILRAITQYGCVDTLMDVVSISFVKGLYFPNAFIPAMTHDEGLCRFQPKGVGLVSYTIQVYDHWGVCVWSSDKIDPEGRPAEYWDGTFKGEDAPKATYTWKAHAIFIDGSVWEGNGNLELLR